MDKIYKLEIGRNQYDRIAETFNEANGLIAVGYDSKKDTVIFTISEQLRKRFAKFAKKNDVPLLGQIPIVQSIRESGDNGYPAVMTQGITADAYKELAAGLARQVAIRNAKGNKTQVVEVTV